MPNEIDFRHVLASLLEWRGRLGRRGFGIIFAGTAYAIVAARLLRAFLPSFMGLTLVAALAAIVCIAMIRRLHDRGRSGWWLLVAFGPVSALAAVQWWIMEAQTAGNLSEPVAVLDLAAVLAGIPMFWGGVEIFLLQGTPGPNRFGPDPLARR